jgi:hypothetical protein
MKRTIFITIVCFATIVSCGSIPRKVKNALTICYTGTHTNIGELININGYFSNPWNFDRSLIFYDNGLVVSKFRDYNQERRNNNEPRDVHLFLKEVVDNPYTRDANFYYDFVDCGNYIISGDIIKVQMIHKTQSMNDMGYGRELWYKIIDRNTLQCIKVIFLTTNKRDKASYARYESNGPDLGVYSTFVPTEAIPSPNYYWILKEKWFWCNNVP